MSPTKTLIALLLLIPTLTVAAPTKVIQSIPDRQTLTNHLRSLGYKTRGGIDRATTDRNEGQGGSFPYFTSSFSVGGANYPFTMVGYPPRSGRPATIRSVVIPLRMNFVYFGANGDVSYTFEPGPALTNLINSPLFVPARFPNGYGQFGDQLQRAAFWNRMDHEHQWHVRMDGPAVLPTLDIEVTPETGTLYQDAAGNFFGDVLFDFVDSQIQTILQLLDLPADTLPIFLTDNVTNEALGYHNAYPVTNGTGGTRLQTFIFTSWLDPALVDPLFADVSTANHELGEWLNDPFIQNVVPYWQYPPPTDPLAACAYNPFLEVGDPQGNGPTYSDFPTIGVTLRGVTYHLQQLVLWQWFADEVPSSAFGGWYTFPAPGSLRVPAVYCP